MEADMPESSKKLKNKHSERRRKPNIANSLVSILKIKE